MFNNATFTQNDKKVTFNTCLTIIYVKTSDSLPEAVYLDALKTEEADEKTNVKRKKM